MFRLGLTCCATVAFLSLRPHPGSPPASAPDSLYTLRQAKHSLRFFHTRYRNFHNQIDIRSAPFKCENAIASFCFGPANGSLPFGAPRYAMPVMFRNMPGVLDRLLVKRVNAMVTQLMRELDAAQKRLPGDRWIVGQRVFQLMQHGEMERSLEVARSCRSDQWWCAGLVGFVSAVMGHDARADSAFSAALNAMTPGERCLWDDAGDLLHGDDGRRWYAQLSCEEKQRTNEALWWLADPLYLTPGNERRSAHYFRQVFQQVFFDSNDRLPEPLLPPPPGSRSRRTVGWADIQNPAMKVSGLSVFEKTIWIDAAVTSIVRSMGVPSFFMVQVEPGIIPDTLILLQYPQPTYHFIPTLAAAREPLSAVESDWDLHSITASERYHPRFGVFAPLEHQVAWFRRGDSAVVVAAADVSNNVLLHDNPNALVTSALALTTEPGDVRLYRDSLPNTRTTFSVLAPAESSIVSLEAMVAGKGAMRARFASGPPPMPAQRVTMSDILVLRRDSSDVLPASLIAASRAAIAGPGVREGGSLVAFWEVYGVLPGDTLSFTISASQKGATTLTRLGRLIGVGARETATGASWTEHVAAANAVEARSVAVDVSTLGRGKYTLSLETSVKGQQPVRVTREIVIVR
jgi:hypothetical protein